MKRLIFLLGASLLIGWMPANAAYYTPLEIAELKKEAIGGDVEKQAELSRIYFFGYGVRKDVHEARKWLRMAAVKGHAFSQDRMGKIAYDNKSYREAIEWWKKAAAQGEAESQYSLGRIFHDGKGVSVNFSVALKYYKQAAEGGHARAHFEIGTFYATGHAGEQDYGKAKEWFKNGCELKSEQACKAYQRLHERGY